MRRCFGALLGDFLGCPIDLLYTWVYNSIERTEEVYGMAGATLRTQTVRQALEALERQAERCEQRAEQWAQQAGREDILVRAEWVRAEALREAVAYLRVTLGLAE